MDISYDKKFKVYVLENITYTKDEFLAYHIQKVIY